MGERPVKSIWLLFSVTFTSSLATRQNHNHHKCEGKNHTLIKMRKDSLHSMRRRRILWFVCVIKRYSSAIFVFYHGVAYLTRQTVFLLPTLWFRAFFSCYCRLRAVFYFLQNHWKSVFSAYALIPSENSTDLREKVIPGIKGEKIKQVMGVIAFFTDRLLDTSTTLDICLVQIWLHSRAYVRIVY